MTSLEAHRAEMERERELETADYDPAPTEWALAYARAYLQKLEGAQTTDLEELPRCPAGTCWECTKHTTDRIAYGVMPLCPSCTFRRVRVHIKLTGTED